MAKIGVNPTGDYLVELDTPNPCAMGRVRNDVPQAGRLNRIYEAIELVCASNNDLDERVTVIENNTETSGGDGCPDYCGNGSPEGVVTANIGSSYMQNDAASTSHSRWVKFSNAGNTGWRQWNGLRGGAGANTALRMGDNSVASATDSIAFGENASATGVRAVALGKTAVAAARDSVAIGNNLTSDFDYMVNIGRGNTWETPDEASGAFSFWGRISIGFENEVFNGGAGDSHGNTVVLGYSNSVRSTASSYNSPCIVIGSNQDVTGEAIIAIGSNSGVAGDEGTAITESTYGVVIGQSILTRADCFVAIGYQSEAFGIGGHALGTHSSAGVDGDSVNCTAIGRFAAALGDDTISLGSDSSVSAASPRSIAIGSGAAVTGAEAIALGTNAANSVANTMVIGSATEPIDTITVITSTGSKTVTLV